jgi:hypothetical protein
VALIHGASRNGSGDGGRLNIDARHAAGVAGLTVGEIATTLNRAGVQATWSDRGSPNSTG